MKADKDLVLELLDSNLTTTEIHKATGIPMMTISDLRNRECDSKIDKMQFRNAAKLTAYMEEIKMKRNIEGSERVRSGFCYDNLQVVHFDKGSETYDLGFLIDGENHYIQVQAGDHPEAEENESYFDDKDVVNKIIEEEFED